jgi:hypothetical protein
MQPINLNGIDYQQIIKWAVIVLVAGFIGHFGRALAEYLIAKARRKRGVADQATRVPARMPYPAESPQTGDNRTEKTERAKSIAEKKTLNAKLKFQKKGR